KKTVVVLDSEFESLNKVVPQKILKLISFKDKKYVFKSVDLLISLGGDGTLIGISRKVSPKLPIFGVNLGHLGFITEYSKTDFYDELEDVINGKFELIKKQLFQLTIKNGEERKHHFFNDIVFTKNDIARMFSLSLEVEHEHV